METKDLSFEIKELTEAGTFEAYVSVFGNVDAYDDLIKKGAFANSIKEQKRYPLLWQHDSRNPIGGWEAIEDDYGLKMINASFNMEVQQAKDAYALAKRGDISGFSIGYETIESEKDTDGIRTLTEVKLWEGSFVTFPANDLAVLTDIKNKTIVSLEVAEKIATKRDFEKLLRDSGNFSREAATLLASKYFITPEQREAAEEEKVNMELRCLAANLLNNIKRSQK